MRHTPPDEPSVFLCQLHEPATRKTVRVLAQLLAQRGVTVVHDAVLKQSNPASLPQWMSSGIEQSTTVICLVTRAFTEACADNPDGHLGTAFEWRAVLRKLYQHEGAVGCPVIPVCLPNFDPDDVPFALRGLEVGRFDPVTGEGIEVIHARIVQAHEFARAAKTGAAPVRPRRDTRPGIRVPSPVRKQLDRLGQVNPACSTAPRLARAWIDSARAANVPHTAEFVRAFTLIDVIARHAGDLDLLGDVTDVCLAAAARVDLDDETKQATARYLIRGLARLRYHQDRQEEALAAAERGLALATEAHDLGLEADARRRLGRVHRVLAEIAGEDRHDEHLRNALDCAGKALDFFRSAADSKERATTELVLAEVHLTTYQRSGRSKDLQRAHELGDRALACYSDTQLAKHHEANLLRARIDIEEGDYPAATDRLDHLLRALKPRVDKRVFAELLGRAYLALARLHANRRRWRRQPARVSAAAAEKIFDTLGLPRLAAESEWLGIRVTPRDLGLSRNDIRTIERLCFDPAERVALARRGRRWTTWQGFCGWFGRRNWKRALRELRAEKARAWAEKREKEPV